MEKYREFIYSRRAHIALNVGYNIGIILQRFFNNIHSIEDQCY